MNKQTVKKVAPWNKWLCSIACFLNNNILCMDIDIHYCCSNKGKKNSEYVCNQNLGYLKVFTASF